LDLFDPTWSDVMLNGRWLTHNAWVPGDRWEFPPPDFIALEQPQKTLWVDRGTVRQVCTQANGVLSLALLAQAPAPVRQQARLFPPQLFGTVLSNLWQPGGDQRITGYWELNAAVQQVPGFAFQWTLLDSPYNASVGVRFDVRVFTDDLNVQWVVYRDAINQTTFNVSSNNGFDARQFHLYGFEKTANVLSFYIDRNLVCTANNPGGPFAANLLFTYLSTVSADYVGGSLPVLEALPANAQLGSYNIYAARPF